MAIKVKKRSGILEDLDISKIQKHTNKAVAGLEGVNQSELEVDAHLKFVDGMTSSEIQDTLIKTAVEKIDIDVPNWTFVAARLFLYDIYHTVGRKLGNKKGSAYGDLELYIDYAVEHGKMYVNIKDGMDLKKLNNSIKPERDNLFNYLGVKTLFDRYLLKNENREVIELPQHMFMAIAMFLASIEKPENKTETAIEFYNAISTQEVMLATPTLSNARTNRHQLSSCYVGSLYDGIEGIFDTFKRMGLLSKHGGGIGWDWAKKRATGSSINGYKKASNGAIPFLKITNDVAIAVDQLGTRPGAIATYVEPWHLDIMDFIDLKKNSGEERRRTHDLFPALWISDLFMKRILDNDKWTLFDPYQVPDLTETYGEEFEKAYLAYENDSSIEKETINAKDLWKKILTSYFESGSPFLCFKDNANQKHQNGHNGLIRSSNLCVTGDTRLATQFGLIKAKELEKENKKILATYDLRVNGDDKNYGTSVAECIEMYKTKEDADIFEIKTKDGYSIKSTNWHEYYVKRNSKIMKLPLKDILESDKLLIQSEKGQFGLEGSRELGFLMGLMSGDGNFSIKEKKNYSITHVDLYNNDMDLKYIVKDSIEKVIKKEYSKLSKPHKQELDIKIHKEIKHTENSIKMRFSNGRLGRVLDEIYNFNKKTKLKVPEVVYQGKEEMVTSYLQGLFFSDSYIEKIISSNNNESFGIKLASIEEDYLKEVQVLLSNYGIRSKIYASERKNLFLLSIDGNNAIRFIEDIGFIGHKQEQALNILNNIYIKYGRCNSRKNEKFEVEIKEIKYVGKEDVYDTTQLLNHSLIFNGIVTGNCTEIFQSTQPSDYHIKFYIDNGNKSVTFEEEEIVELSNGKKKMAKSVTALETLADFYKVDKNIGEVETLKVYNIEKERIDGKTAVCNLASVNLSKINKKEDIERVVPVGIHMLDNVIDLNFYPYKEVKDTNLDTRAIGLGVMGEAQMLAENKIHFGSEEHMVKIDEIMEAIAYNSIKASSDIAKEKGSYDTFEGSDWSKGILHTDKWTDKQKELVDRELVYDWGALKEKVKKDGLRNGYLMAVAPTSTISILCSTTQAIEPIYKRKWYEENASGLIPVVAPNLSPDTWGFYNPAFEVEQLNLIRVAAVRQKWIDQGQSVNVFMNLQKASGKYLHQIYTLAWQLGLKSTYYLRGESPEAENDVADRSIECSGCQ